MGKKYKIDCLNRKCGLFSDFVHGILPSLIYLKDIGVHYDDIDIYWINDLYQNDNENLYEFFFNKRVKYEVHDIDLSINNCPYGIFFKHHNTIDLLLKGYETIKHYEIDISSFFKNKQLPFSLNEKVLGVQQRKTDHFKETMVISDEKLIEKISNQLLVDKYDKIFLITDDNNTLIKLKKHFGDILVYNVCHRSINNTPIHYDDEINNDDKIKAIEVMFDSYCLSLTDYMMICNSNVSTYSLLISGNNNFNYIDI